jgi:hypothetical protein
MAGRTRKLFFTVFQKPKSSPPSLKSYGGADGKTLFYCFSKTQIVEKCRFSCFSKTQIVEKCRFSVFQKPKLSRNVPFAISQKPKAEKAIFGFLTT